MEVDAANVADVFSEGSGRGAGGGSIGMLTEDALRGAASSLLTVMVCCRLDRKDCGDFMEPLTEDAERDAGRRCTEVEAGTEDSAEGGAVHEDGA